MRLLGHRSLRVVGWSLSLWVGALAPDFATAQVTTRPDAPPERGGAIQPRTTLPTTRAPRAAEAAERAPAGKTLVASGLGEDGALRLDLNKSQVLTTSRPYKRISVGSADVTEVNGINPTRLLVTAKKVGSTQIILWDDDENSETIDVVVQADVRGLREIYKLLLPDAKVDVHMNESAIVLSGRVPNLTTGEQAQLIAGCYGSKVLNLLEIYGEQQVMLQVRLAEVSKSATNQLGVNLGYSDGSSFFGSNIGQVSPFQIEAGEGGIGSEIAFGGPSASVTQFGRMTSGNSTFGYMITALRQNNLLRILAEPNLVATSGQEASFLAGGEFPIPVTQGGGGTGDVAITIEYREFGVRLRFTPVVLGDGKIRLKVEPEVSDLDFTTAVRFGGFVIPGLSTRKLLTTVELADGETFAVAGLLNHNVTSTKDVTPVLGDLPVLGTLFRSVRYQRKETELVVLVTPRIVSGLRPGEVPLLPGEVWRHPSEAELFLNQDLGGPEKNAPSPPTAPPRRFIGRYGFVPAGQGTAPAAGGEMVPSPATGPAQGP